MNRTTENILSIFSQSDKTTYTKEEVINIITKSSNVKNLPILECGNVIANPINKVVMVDNVGHTLPNKEFMLLYYLMSNKNKVIKREEIMREIWGGDVIVIDRTIDVHVRKIRQVVGHQNLQTIKCVGYGWFDEINLVVS